MLYGDKEGFNRIYNSSGEPLLRANETLESNHEGTWKGLYFKSGLKYVNQYKTYRGIFYVTNSRLIFIGTPKPLGRRAIVAVSGIGKVASMGEFAAAREKLSEYRDFFEIRFMEIKKIGGTPISIQVFGKDNRHKYRVDLSKEIETDLNREYLAAKQMS